MTSGDRAHVMMFLPHLGGGGAERHLLRVANHLDRTRFRVSLAVSRAGGAFEDERAPDIPVHVLGGRMRNALIPLARLLARERPDLLFSVMDHSNCIAIVAAKISRARPAVAVGVQIPVTIELRRNPNRATALLKAMLPLFYPRADAIIALSKGVREDLTRWMPRVSDRTLVIYNAGYDALTLSRSEEPADVPPQFQQGPKIVACGRFVEQKGFALLLDAFAEVRRRSPAKLWLVGDGPLRADLEQRARGLGIADAVWFAGFRPNPYSLMRRADLFVLSSLWEGFANVIVEAMAVGTPVVSVDCPFGPGEIIRHGGEGILVPVGAVPPLAAAIHQVIGDPALRARLGEAGRRRATDFSAERIAAQYGAVFSRLTSRARLGAAA